MNVCMVIRNKFQIVLYLNVSQNVHVSFVMETYIVFDVVMIYQYYGGHLVVHV